MITLPNETRTVENPILEWLHTSELGWRFEDRRSVEREYRARTPDGGVDEVETLLIPILREKLRTLNPEVITDDERADRVLTLLRGLRDNQEWITWLRNEKTFKFAADEHAQLVRLVDYDDLDNNDFLVTSQFRVAGPSDNIRTDLLLFLNGVPIVNVEAKTTGRDWHVDWTEGAKQCARYQREAPQLYYSNVFCGAVNELVFRYGIPGMKFHEWHQWRDPAPHDIPEAEEMRCAVYGLLDRGNLLDILRNYIVFETIQGQTVKKVTRYQQFRAANELVLRSIEVEKPQGWRRGIVWHTQGSGKSLTILFAAKKLWHHPALQQPTIIVIVDRDQLQDQMIGQFIRANAENCRVAESKDDLIALLAEGDGYRGVIVTIMHKFSNRDQVVINRRNVIALVDEAHRSQEGNLGQWMRTALPEASLFGFTGTPIENADHNTPRFFGRVKGVNEKGEEIIERYMDRYSIADALRDGATVAISYEPRLSDWALWGERLDQVFEREFAHLVEGEREQLKRENAQLKHLLKHSKRIGLIAEDVVQDFLERVRPNGFKAMLVCYDKETCILYKAAIDQLLDPSISLCVYSEDPEHDSQEVKQHYLGEATRKKAIDEFKKERISDPDEVAKPENRWRNVEIFIVCDMLLTGFDAPILQTMYLDKGLRDHTLLQAVARVNRPYSELKNEGVIKDYFGVFERLNEALNFDRNELGEIAFPFKKLRDKFVLEMRLMGELLAEFPRQAEYATILGILTWFNTHEPEREKFEQGFHSLSLLWESLFPDPSLATYEAEYAWLTRLWMYYRKKFYPLSDRFETDPADGTKTRELIRKYVDVEDLKRDLPIYRIDVDFLTKLKDTPPDAKALDIEAMLAAELKIRFDEDEDYLPLSERLKHIIQQKRQASLTGLALLAELENLTRDVVDLLEESKRPLAESIAKMACDRSEGLDEQESRKISVRMIQKADEFCFPGWEEQEHITAELFREFTILLVTEFPATGLYNPNTEFVIRCIKLLRKARYKGQSA